MAQNNLHSFHLEQMPLSGRIVRLDSVVQDVLDKHNYPRVVNTVLAEMMALASVLSGSFKYTGKLTLQVKGTGGIIQTAVVEVTHEGDMRAYARYDQELAIIEIEGKPTLEQLFGSGLMIFNLDQGDRIEPYQGIVSLTGESLGQAIEHYWAQSEQFRGAIFLTSQSIDGVLQSGALVIHQLPGGTDDQWDYGLALLNTLRTEEFLNTDLLIPDILYRLFHSEGLNIFKGVSLKAECHCSKEKLAVVFNRFSKQDLLSLLENDQIKANCEFCNTTYDFTRMELKL